MKMVDWNYYDKFEDINNKYLPACGEGETKATQLVTAINKLIYKWYNDGDVFDNTGYLDGWANDLSSYANWISNYIDDADSILEDVFEALEDDYEVMLQTLADTYLKEDILKELNKQEKIDSIYEATGKYKFIEKYDEEVE